MRLEIIKHAIQSNNEMPRVGMGSLKKKLGPLMKRTDNGSGHMGRSGNPQRLMSYEPEILPSGPL